MNARLAALGPRLGAAFGDVPIAPAEVRRMSPAVEARGRAGYREPGAYYVDLKAIRERPAWTLPSVAFHELTPGHLLQGVAADRSAAWRGGVFGGLGDLCRAVGGGPRGL